jgi:hypothetical protein
VRQLKFDQLLHDPCRNQASEQTGADRGELVLVWDEETGSVQRSSPVWLLQPLADDHFLAI